MAFFGRFTERAQKALLYAQEEARSMGHNYVGTEHLLLGLLREQDGAAAKVLANMGMELDKMRDYIVKLVGKGNFNFNEGFGYTPRTKRVMELSFYEARNLGHNYVGTEHLLLALIREGEGVAARILKDANIDFEKIRTEIMQMVQEEAGESQSTPKGKSNTPNLDQFGRDLTEMAREGKLDPVIGRDNEIERAVKG
jgi:ATP-dependent Clp protease ATP-binding subunit ClpC